MYLSPIFLSLVINILLFTWDAGRAYSVLSSSPPLLRGLLPLLYFHKTPSPLCLTLIASKEEFAKNAAEHFPLVHEWSTLLSMGGQDAVLGLGFRMLVPQCCRAGQYSPSILNAHGNSCSYKHVGPAAESVAEEPS